ncbi:hypothetical protein, partial [Escherichia coli]|uniref:hypothetical protein n=1 Tax=Escherichia coli TaxID=562 RepID=UPI00211A3983
AEIRELKFGDRPLMGTHVDVVRIKPGKTDCDVLLLPHDLRAAAVALIESPNALRADLIIITGAIDEEPERISALIESIRTQGRASAVCIV